MSKGLEALQEMRDEAVSSICRYVPRQAHEEVTGYFDKRKSIIEKELKDYETFKTGLILGNMSIVDNKILKALEIIKNKDVNTEMIKLSKDYFEYDASTYKVDILTQEEFDLLKEVLLWID